MANNNQTNNGSEDNDKVKKDLKMPKWESFQTDENKNENENDNSDKENSGTYALCRPASIFITNYSFLLS